MKEDPFTSPEARQRARALVGRLRRRERAKGRAMLEAAAANQKAHTHVAQLVTAPASEGQKLIVLDEIEEERCYCGLLMGFPS